MTLIQKALRNPDGIIRRVFGPPVERPYSRFLFANRFGAIPEKPRKSGKSPESGYVRMTNFREGDTPGFRLIRRELSTSITWVNFSLVHMIVSEIFRKNLEKSEKSGKSGL